MAKLVKKSLSLAVMTVAILVGILSLSTKSPYRELLARWTDSIDYLAGEGEVESYIRAVQEENDATKLILGDSVCNQMFNELKEYNKDYCIVGNNRGLTMAGEYLLLNEFLKTHENVTDVYLIVGLDALETEINTTFGYPYVVIPFSRIDVLDELEDETRGHMSDIFGEVFLNKHIAQVIGDSSVGRKLYFSYLKQSRASGDGEVEHGTLPDTTVIYLKKMYQLCEEAGIMLHLLPDPQTDNSFRRNQASLLEEEFERNGLAEYFPEYFSLIGYYPEEEFSDGVHFGEGYDDRETFNDKIRELYLDAGYLEGLYLDFPLK